MKKKKNNENDKFVPMMKVFYGSSCSKLNALQKHLEKTLKIVQDIAEQFGEQVKPNQFKVEEFLAIFNTFREQFIEAKIKIEEIEEKREKELKKKMAEERRKQEKEEIKRKKKGEKTKEEKKKRQQTKLHSGEKNKATDNNEHKHNNENENRNDADKTDKMLDEMGDTSKYLAKLKQSRKIGKIHDKNKRKQLMFFKSRHTVTKDSGDYDERENRAHRRSETVDLNEVKDKN